MDTGTTLFISLNNLTCRTCLKDYENSNSLYDEMEYDEGRMELKDVLQTTVNVDISRNEMLTPTRICFDCTEKLVSAFEFIRSTQKSEKLLQECCTEEEIKDAEIFKIGIEDEKEANSAEQESEEETQELEVLDEQFEMLVDVDDDVEICNADTSTIEVEKSVPAQHHKELKQTKDTKDTIKKTQKNVPTPSATTAATTNRSSNMRFTIGSRLGYETSNWHVCKDCPRSFAKEETLRKHIKAAHTYASAECIKALAPKPTKEQPFQCPICPRTFSRKDTLQRHNVAMHTTEPAAPSELQEIIAEEKKLKYKRGLCPHCGRSFSQASLIIHIRRHTGEKPYKCDQCEKGFPRRQDLVIHQRQHTGEKPHVCTLCGKSFIRPNKLSRHMRVHTGSRPYKCEKCDKSFSQSNDLRIHMRRHTGEKPYTCSVCNEGFICGSALKSHRKSKSHFNPDDADPDPYANCRVNNRSNTKLTTLAVKQSLKISDKHELVSGNEHE